eukprot:m.16447 g.16447  ORF g.16447 m.16447 type:complete len:569 (+) comp3140_c0_seq1:324-2030(+)
MSVDLLVHAAQALAPVIEDATGNSDSDGDSAAERSDSEAAPASPARPVVGGQPEGSVLYSSQLSFSKNASANSADSALIIDDKAGRHERDGDAASDGSLMCSHPGCTKTFFSRQALTRHVRVHQGLRPHYCTSCGNQFRCASHLKRHERQHSNSRPYTCPICNKAYIDHTNLIRHTVVQHNARPYVCGWPGCSNAFTMERTLREHITAAHGICPLRANGQAKRTFMIYGLEGAGDSSTNAGPASSPCQQELVAHDSDEQPESNANDVAQPDAAQSAPVIRVAENRTAMPSSEPTTEQSSPCKRTRIEPDSASAAIGSPRSVSAAVVSSTVSTIRTEPLMHPAIPPSVSSAEMIMDAAARARATSIAIAPLAATAARIAAPAAPLVRMSGVPGADACTYGPYLLGQPDAMRPAFMVPWQGQGYAPRMGAGVDMAKSFAAAQQLMLNPASLTAATATTLASPMMSSLPSLRGSYCMPFGQAAPGPAWGMNPMYSPYMPQPQLEALQAMQAYSMASGAYSMASGPYMTSGPAGLAAFNPTLGLGRFGAGFLPGQHPGQSTGFPHQSTGFPQ